MQAWRPPPGSLLVSIVDAGHGPARVPEGWSDVLRLEFDDVPRHAPGSTPCTPRVLDPELGRLLRWVEHLPAQAALTSLPSPVLGVHCRYGQGRSPGFAQGVALACGWRAALTQLEAQFPLANAWVRRVVSEGCAAGLAPDGSRRRGA